MANNDNTKLIVARTEAREKIQDRINKGNELLNTPVNSQTELDNLKSETRKWIDYNLTLFKTLFSKSPLSAWTHGSINFAIAYRENALYRETNDYKENIQDWTNQLESIYERLDLYEETTRIREKIRHVKTATISKIKSLVKNHWKKWLSGIIISVIAGIILFHMGC